MFIEDIIISRVRVKILDLFLKNPGQIYHVREIVRRTGEEINAVRRELSHMEKTQMAVKEPRANRVYYSFRKDYPLYGDLLYLMAKSFGLGALLLKNKNKIGRIKYAMFSGRFVRGMVHMAEKVDLLIVGSVLVEELSKYLSEEEKRRGYEINYTVMSEEEFSFRKRRRDPFIVEILSGGRMMLIGDEEEMLKE